MGLSIEELEKKKSYLRNQKITKSGSYADLLTDTYNCIKKLINNSDKDYCNPYDADISQYIYGNRLQLTMIRKFLYELKIMGYIEIHKAGTNREIYIIKDLDF